MSILAFKGGLTERYYCGSLRTWQNSLSGRDSGGTATELITITFIYLTQTSLWNESFMGRLQMVRINKWINKFFIQDIAQINLYLLFKCRMHPASSNSKQCVLSPTWRWLCRLLKEYINVRIITVYWQNKDFDFGHLKLWGSKRRIGLRNICKVK